jgi:hypothetical protein
MYEYIGILLGARPILHISRMKVNISGSSYFRDIKPQFAHAEEHWNTDFYLYRKKIQDITWHLITFGEVLLSLKLAEIRPATSLQHATYCYLITIFNVTH